MTVSEYLHGQILESNELETFLNALARLAVHELSNDDEHVLCGVTLLRRNHGATVASSSEEAQKLDEVQYNFSEGPCLTASRTQTEVEVFDFRSDERWPEYARFVHDLGIRSLLAIPFKLEGEDKAALNLYASVPGSFTADKVERARNYASEASQAFALSVRLARHEDAASNATDAMKSRTTIDLAVGIIMGQNSCSQESAVEILKSASTSRRIKLRDVASSLVSSLNVKAPTTHFER